MPAANIVDLRRFLSERFPQGPAIRNSRLRTGLDFFDEVLGGGLPKGAITELITPATSAGSASVIQSLIRTAQQDGYFVALIDGEDSFDPQTLGPDGLPHLLWVRCTRAAEAIKAADLLLRDRNFSLVIVDLILNPASELGKIPQTNWYRLQRLAEPASVACLVLTRQNLASSAQLKITLTNSWKLQSLETGISQLQFHVQRSHLRSEIFNQRSG